MASFWTGIERGPDTAGFLQAAMFAMLAAFGAEVSTRTPVFVQIQKAPLAIAATFVVIIAASVQSQLCIFWLASPV